MRHFALCVFAAILTVAPAFAQKEANEETIEELASEDEAAKVKETLSQIGCQATQIEKESKNLFEIDDAECKIGQYDIKLNGSYKITSMTLDE